MTHLSKYKTLGELLRDLRKKTQSTQIAIASKVDISNSYLSKLETDKIKPLAGKVKESMQIFPQMEEKLVKKICISKTT